MRRSSLVLIAFVLAGCRQLLGIDDPVVAEDAAVDDVPPDAEPGTDDGWGSGSRLKLAWNDYRGVRADMTMFDPQLGVQCIAYAWADGKRYCAPRNFNPPIEGVGYLDQNCTQPIGYRLHNDCSLANPPAFLTQAMQQSCAGYARTKVFRRGAALAPRATLYVNHSGTCKPTDFPASSHDLYVLGEEIPTSSLVEMTETRIAIDDRVSRVDYRGSDGSSYAGGSFDTALGVICSPTDTGTCSPTIGGTSPAYADAACGSPVAAVQEGCPAPRLGSRPTQPGCPNSATRYFPVTEQLQPVSLYLLNGMMCAPALISVATDYYGTGAEVAPATLPRAVDAPPPSSAIALVHFGAPGERVRGGIYDYTHASLCATQGGRCLPSNGAGTATHFVDSLCATSRTFAVVSPALVGCMAPPPPDLVVQQTTPSGMCSTTYQVFERGAKYTGPVYSGSPGACSATSSYFDLYELGAVVPQVEFAVATPMIDP